MAYNFSRYRNRDIFVNRDPSYINQLNARKVDQIAQFGTAKFKWPTEGLLGAITIEREYWGTGHRFYKLADKYYGDASLWWIIPWFNQRPLESDFKAGTPVMIPLPLELVLNFFK
tara:strand:+ start:6277 stop:6621 length:345 start_codon:yes stop_codon:yes gene_type:complete